MNKFSVGDQVFDLRYGFGKITGNNPGLNQIYFEYSENEQVEVFNKDGRRVFSDFAPSLLTLEEAAKLGYFPDGSRHQISGGTKTNYQLVLNKIKGQLAFVHGAYQGLLMTENLEARNLFKMLLDETKELKELLENEE